MKIKPTDRFTLSSKELEKQEFLKRISNLNWDNAEVIIPNSVNCVNNQKNNSENK